MKSVQEVFDMIVESDELKAALQKAVENNAVGDFLKAQGCESSEEEFIELLKDEAEARELSVEQLDQVAGGHTVEYVESVLVWWTCAIAYTISVSGGEGNKESVLCDNTGK